MTTEPWGLGFQNLVAIKGLVIELVRSGTTTYRSQIYGAIKDTLRMSHMVDVGEKTFQHTTWSLVH